MTLLCSPRDLKYLAILLYPPLPPTSLAVDPDGRLGITLAGFVRGARFNIYTHWEKCPRSMKYSLKTLSA